MSRSVRQRPQSLLARTDRAMQCDGRPEVCRQCVRFGLLCSGPVQGPIILDMSVQVSRPRKKRRVNTGGLDEDSPRTRASTADSDGIEAIAASATSAVDEQDRSTSSCPSPANWDLDLGAQKSPKDPRLSLAIVDVLDGSNFFEQCLVEKFVDLASSSRLGMSPHRPKSWMFALPSLWSTTKTAAVKYSIRAASLAYFAVVQRNKGAEVEAIRWYTAGIESHRGFIQDCTRRDARSPSHEPPPSSDDLAVPLMFLYFETVRPTSLDAWAHHIGVVVSTVEARGPDQYRTGTDHVMFRSLRTYAVCL